MTRSQIIRTAWFVPLWLAAAYSLGSSVYYLYKARREQFRTGVEPFILWRDECLTTSGLELRRRGTRAVGRFVLIVIVAIIGARLIDSLVGAQ